MPQDGEEFNSMELWRARTEGIDRAPGDPTKAEAENYVESGNTATDAADKIDSNPEVAKSAGIDTSDGSTHLTVSDDQEGPVSLDDVQAEKTVEQDNKTATVTADLDVSRSDGSAAFDAAVQDVSTSVSTTDQQDQDSSPDQDKADRTKTETTTDQSPDQEEADKSTSSSSGTSSPDQEAADDTRTTTNSGTPTVTGAKTSDSSGLLGDIGVAEAGAVALGPVLAGVALVAALVFGGGN